MSPSLAFEIMVLVLTVVTLRHCRRRGREDTVLFLTLCAFGLVIEGAVIDFVDGYHYGAFLLMVRDVPLCIGLSWGILILSAMRTADRLQIPVRVRPLFDALLVLLVDVGMDVVAVELGFWNWHVLDWYAVWQGIPLGNYYAWFLVTFFVSLTWRSLPAVAPWDLGRLLPLRALLSVCLGLGGVIACLSLQKVPTHPVFQATLLAVILLAASGAVVAAIVRRGGRLVLNHRPEWSLLAGPACFHGFFLLFLGLTGLYRDPSLTLISVLAIGVSLTLHLLPSLGLAVRPAALRPVLQATS